MVRKLIAETFGYSIRVIYTGHGPMRRDRSALLSQCHTFKLLEILTLTAHHSPFLIAEKQGGTWRLF